LAKPRGRARDASLSIHIDGEDVRLLPVVAAHTDGDTIVSFPGHDIICR
jgi:cyclase